MMATWFQGPASEFIEVSRAGFERGVSILHFLGGISDRPRGRARDRADQDDDLASAAMVDGVLCRRRVHRPFLRLLRERRAGAVAVVRRQPIYEKDRMDPVDPAARLVLDAALLERFPDGYRHLAYLQTRIGYTIKLDMPQLRGPAVELLYRQGRQWLQGAATAFAQ